jgi:hypothetical protein
MGHDVVSAASIARLHLVQVNAVETLYFQLLGEVEALEGPAAGEMAALQEQRSRVAALDAALPC